MPTKTKSPKKPVQAEKPKPAPKRKGREDVNQAAFRIVRETTDSR